MNVTSHPNRVVLLLIAFAAIVGSRLRSGASEFDPMIESAGGSAEGFDYFTNNWNVIGLKDYVHGSRITPDNQLVLADKTPIQIRIGSDRKPLGCENPKRALHGWMPIIVVTAD
jgi:hypothetical protein